MTEDQPDDSRVLAVYRRYVGEPERPADIYGGFALFFGGIVMAALGLILFLWSVALPENAALFWQLREIGIVLASLGLPAFILSVVVLLPVSRRAVYGAFAGTVVCLAAIGLFTWAYPAQWNVIGGTDYSAQGVAIYAGGMAILAAATGSALVAHHIDRSSPAAAGAGAESASAPETAEETVSSEQVERDIEEAMANTELTWGGVDRKANTRRLELNLPDTDTVQSSASPESANTARSEGVDNAVAGLRNLQGGGPKEAASESVVDEQTAALRELRERQRAEEAEETGLTDRLRRLFGSS